MPVSFSCRRPSWLQSWVQTRGEEEQVNAEGRSGGRVDKRKTAHRGRLLLGDTRLILSWQQANVRLGIWTFFSLSSPHFLWCICFGSFLGQVWEVSWGSNVCGFGGKNGTWVRVGWRNRSCVIFDIMTLIFTGSIFWLRMESPGQDDRNLTVFHIRQIPRLLL